MVKSVQREEHPLSVSAILQEAEGKLTSEVC